MNTRKAFFVLVVLLALCLAGCCENPGGASTAKAYKDLLVNTYYTTSGTLKPQIKEMGQYDAYVALGATLADQALALAGALEQQKCIADAQLAQLESTAKQAVAAAPKTTPTP